MTENLIASLNNLSLSKAVLLTILATSTTTTGTLTAGQAIFGTEETAMADIKTQLAVVVADMKSMSVSVEAIKDEMLLMDLKIRDTVDAGITTHEARGIHDGAGPVEDVRRNDDRIRDLEIEAARKQ